MNQIKGARVEIKVRELRSLVIPELAILLARWLPIEKEVPEPTNSRRRTYTTCRTLLLFLYQVLSGNLSFEEVVQKAIGWLEPILEKKISPNTGGYSQARKRLPSQVLIDFEEQLRKGTPDTSTFHGHTVKVGDGTGISMPDTEANRKAFPPSSQSGSNSGFPGLRLLVIFSLHLGTIINWAVDKMKVSEHHLFQSIWPSLNKGDLFMGDRGFCSYSEFAWLKTRGIESLTTKSGTRKHHKIRKVLGPNDLLVEWEKPDKAPDWISPEDWKALPETFTVREITFKVTPRGFRTREITLDTTLLDESIPAADFIALYRKRWKAELFLRDIKITLGMDILACKTPEMVEKEVHMFVLAYNLIRLLMFEAAIEKGEEPTKISFSATVQAIKEWGPRLASARSEKEISFLLEQFFRVIGYRRLRNRPNRSEPRAKKRRPKNYALLKGNRHTYKEIPHRDHYRKAA